ncbi:filamentous hemagglutinin N-terminal domain-containing protein [Ramlibacter tataouinensis]|uniref:beta strand repeat-containing protein n=1 Tax=Ramlibacter tataouinensis TaxID=94132 RepID=UPI0022F3CF10|nr:filamentous hemagglutinin N-terminal domain-containing protein [Ramlibacter tataouinensis]WBY01940.1 filamentous hemagglutinin N-terminal domain-containing protein [Ramlibacter tataouinensis]
MNHRPTARAGRTGIRTVIVQISRKLRATYRVRTGRLFSQLLAALLGVYSAQVLALPQGGVVQQGAVTISTPNANSMVLNQGTNKAVINWQSFSIGAGQSVQFLQPGASSVALNRVVGGDVSSIFGTLSANGQVFLVNPAGVLFAPGAQVNVGGLVASTLNLSNADFMAGKYTFSGDSGASVVNNGMIRAGYVALAGAQVANAGTIEAAQGGSVGLLAGSRVSVDPVGAGLVKFSVDSAAVNAAAANSGTIVAEGGQVLMAAQAVGDTLATVVNQSGVIRANSVVENNGLITLSGGATGIVKVTGTIEAKGDDAGETGGTVEVLGDKVGLGSGSVIDASGDAGGGTVLVGGGWQGKGTEQNASATAMATGARIHADAGTSGNGGTIVVWSDGQTAVGGEISARAGSQSGNGGKVETSGKDHLTIADSAKVDATAANGQMGTWLLDPTDIIVATGGAAAVGDVDQFADAGATITIAPATINGAGATVYLQATKDITFSDAVAMTGDGVGLTAQAGENIDVNASITTTNGDVTLSANDSGAGLKSGNGRVAVNAAINAGSGSVTITNNNGGGANQLGSSITAASIGITGTLDLTAASALNATVGTITAQAINGSGNDLSLTSVGTSTTNSLINLGHLTTGAGTNLNAGSVAAGTASLGGNVTTTTSAQTYTGAVTIGGNSTISSTTGAIGFDTIDGSTAGAQSLTVKTSGGAVNFGGAVGSTTALANLTIDAAGKAITLNTTTLTGTLDVTASSLSQTGVLTAGTVQANMTGFFDLSAVGNSIDTVGAISAGGAVLIRDTSGTLAVSGPLTSGGTVNIYAQGAIAIDAAVQGAGAGVVINASGATGDITTTAKGTITATAGSVDLTATRDVRLGAAVNAAGGTTIVVGKDALVGSAGGTFSTTAGITSGSGTSVSGRNGDDTFDFSGAPAITAAVDGGAGTNTLKGASSFELTSAGGGTADGTLSYVNIQNLQGTTATTFYGNGGSVAGTITGGSGVSTLKGTLTSGGAQNYSNGTTLGGHVTLDTGESTDTIDLGTFAGIGSAGNLTVTKGNTSIKGTTSNAGQMTFGDGLTATGNIVAESVKAASLSVGGNITTTKGGQQYGSTTLTAASALSDTGSTAIALGTSVAGGGNNLTLATTGGVSSTGDIAGVAALTTGKGTNLTAQSVTTTGLATLGGNVTTAGTGLTGQSYGGGTTLTGNATLQDTANNALVLGAVAGGGNDLTLTTTGGVDAGVVAGVAALTTSAGTNLNATSVTVTGAAALGGNVTATTGNVSFGSTTLNSNATVSANAGAGTIGLGTVTGNAKDLTLTGLASTSGIIGGGAILANQLTTTGAVTGTSVSVTGAAMLGGNVTATIGNVSFDSTTLDSNATVSANAGAGTIGLGAVTGNSKDLMLTGAATTSGITGVNVLTGNRSLTTTGAVTATSVAVAGVATLGGNVTTTDAAGQVYSGGTVVNADLTLDAGAANPIKLGAVTGNSKDLTLTGAATTSGITGVDVLTANQSLTTTGAVTANSVAVTGAATLGGNVTASTGNLSFGSTVLNADLTLSANGGLGAIGTGVVTGNLKDLTLTGVTTLSTVTNVDVLSASQLTTTGALSAGSVNVTGAATLGGNVTASTGNLSFGSTVLNADLTLSANGGLGAIGTGAVTGNARNLTLTGVATTGAITGAGVLTANRSLTTTGAVTATSVAVAGVATLGGNVTTTDAAGQVYSGGTVLNADLTLDAGAANPIKLGAVTGNSKDLTLTGAATTSGITGVDVLTANQSLTTTGAVTANSVNVGGAASLGGNVTTSGDQTYGSLTLNAPAVALDAGAAKRISTGAITGGGNNLTLTGKATLGTSSGIGALVANQTLDTTGDLGAVSVAVAGATTLGGDVTTTGTAGQTYTGGTTLGANVTLASGAGVNEIKLGAVTGAGKNLTVTSGDTTIASTFSDLGVLSVTHGLKTGGNIGATSVTAGATTLGGDVTTSAGQTYGFTTLEAGVTLSDTADTALSLGNVTGGANSLTLTSKGGVTAGTVDVAGLTTSVGTKLSAKSVTTTGTASLGGDVTTTAGQTYKATTTLTASVTLMDTADTAISLGDLAGGGKDLTLTTKGGVVAASIDNVNNLEQTNGGLEVTGFVGTLGDIDVAGALGVGGILSTVNLSANSANLTGNANATGAVRTTGSLSTGGTLAADSIDAGSSASFGGAVTVTGALKTGTTLTTAGGADISAGSLAATGAASLGGNVTTATTQNYNGGLTLTAASTLSSTGNGNITVLTGLTGNGNNLTIASSGTASIANATGIGTFTAGTNGTTSGAITAAVYNLNGGTVDATFGAGTLNQVSGTTLLNGATSAGAVNVSGGTLKLGSTNRLADSATVTVGVVGTLDLDGYTDTVATANLAGTLAGAGKLTAATYNLNGGTVNANLGAGTLNQVGGTSTLNGTSDATTVNVNGGTLQLGNAANRLASATTVAIGGGATLNTGAAAQKFAAAAITNNGTLTTGGALEAASITSAGTATFGGNVKTTGAQSYTGALATAANSTLEAGGSLTAGNATIGDGTTLRLNGAGTIDVAGNYAGAVKVDGGATSVTLADTSAATPFVINQMTVAPSANVTLNSAGALTVDAANFSQVAKLDVKVSKGDATFLNSSTTRGGQSGVLATGGITMQVDEGNVNTQADPMWVNPATPNLSVTITGAFKAWLAGNVSSDAVTRRILSDAQDGVGASRAEMVREFLHELKRNVGVGAVEDLVLFGGIDMEGITAPLNFSNLAVRLPKCAGEQANSQQCN